MLPKKNHPCIFCTALTCSAALHFPASSSWLPVLQFSFSTSLLIVNSTTQVRLQCPWRRSWRPKARGHAKAEVASTACCKKNLKKLLKIFRKKTIFLLQLKCQSSRGQFRPGVKKNLKKKFYKSEKNNSQLILKMNWQSSRGQCSLL